MMLISLLEMAKWKLLTCTLYDDARKNVNRESEKSFRKMQMQKLACAF